MPVLIVFLINEPHTKESDSTDNGGSFDLHFGWDIGLRGGSDKVLADIFKHISGISEEALHLCTKDLVEFKNYKNKYGNTLLHYSCWYHAIHVTKLLVELNADLIPNKDGNTPLHLSCMRGYVKVTRLLLEYKADVIPNKDGNTPLHLCCIHGYVKETQLLLAFNADLIPNKDGNTPLHLCCIHGYVKLTNVLLDKRLPANTQNNAKLCPLSLSCTKDNLEIVKLLLTYKFNPNAVSNDCVHVGSITASERRFLPITKAVKHLPEAVPLLLQYGACINVSRLGDDMDTVPHMVLINCISEEMQSRFSFLQNILMSGTKNLQYRKALRHIIKAGALISKENKFMQAILFFERKICNKSDMKLIRILVKSGYRFSTQIEYLSI